MSAKPLSLLEVPETVAVFHRTLQDGSRLEYRMQVLQQPERARACGMGAKSHADRRPVDPPPVVELRLFQGAEKTDVTFSHNSNFFLFATLEQARPIAQGRGMPAPAPAPVLTGVPVSGMAYLDRPNPAGYFIFPDLSVRHEGKYRLRFALYEETKDEIFPIPSDSLEPREWATHRLDVKSKAFTVFSAKKFPGLAESTALSRIVAEQGCRVRIRRDVRMRRRSDRQGRDSEDRMDETAMIRAARRGATPEQYNMNESIRPQHDPQYHQPTPHPMQRTNSIGGRGRSGSDASVSSVVSEQIAQPQRYDNGYVAPSQNRSQFGPPSGPPQQSANHHLSFGAHSHPPPAPPQHPSQEIYGQIGRPYSQPHAPVAQHHPSPHLAPSPRPQQSAYGPPPSAYQSRENSISMQGQQMQQPNGHNVRRESVDYRNSRRDSDPVYHQQQYRPNTPSVGPSYMENGYGHHQQQQQQQQPYQAPPPQHYQPQSQAPPSSVSNNLPPLRLPALEPKWRSNQPTTPNSSAPSALQSPGIYPSQNGAIQQQRAPPPPHMAQPPAPPTITTTQALTMSENVPQVLSVAEIYPEALQESQKQRWEHLLAKFQELYGAPADYISRSPGRVNIIGEHIDYMLYSVIPMAVTADFLLAVRLVPGSSTVKLANVLPKFPTREFTIPTTGDLEIDATQHEWSNYFKSGLRGAIELLQKRDGTTRQVGMEILADGTVPSGAGLSSSAAFTCASALASLVAMGEKIVNQKDLVNLAVVAERYVGVNSGGMDQSASVLGQAGSALYISFHPALTAQPIAFPTTSPELTFIIADTLVTADKHTTGPINYNLRVVECTLAAQILAKKLNLGALPADAGPLGNTLKGLMDVYYASSASLPLEQKLEALIDLTKSTLTQEDGYTREEMAAILDTNVDELVRRYMTRFPIRAERFNLRSRAIHVFSEALRVTRFQALLASSSNSNSDTILTQLGALMNESHDSCRDLYNCSCPELDELCSLARKAGSYGSRLTGAGWGGCSVHLVPQDKVEAVKEAWKKEYYEKKFPDMSAEKIEGAVVVSKPGSGAVLFKVTE